MVEHKTNQAIQIPDHSRHYRQYEKLAGVFLASFNLFHDEVSNSFL